MNLLEIIKAADESIDTAPIIDAVVTNGEQSAIELLVKMSVISAALDKLRDAIMPVAVNEMAGTKSLKTCGATVSLAEAGVKWDYSKCNDNTYLAYQDEMKRLKELSSKREVMLKSLVGTSIGAILDEESGEVVNFVPPVRSSKTIIKIEFGKR